MADSLIPTFDIPGVSIEAATETKYKKSWEFDFETGEFAFGGGNKVQEADGWTAWMQWCVKTLMTERFVCLAYSDDIGVEMEEVRNQSNRASCESVLEKTLSEALMVHPGTNTIKNFSYSWEGNELTATFEVVPHEGAAVTLNASTQY